MVTRRLRSILTTPPPVFGAAAERLLDTAALVLVDVGARGGAMQQLVQLAPFAHYVACEPQAAAGERLVAQLQKEQRWSRVTVVPEALASESGRAVLYVTRQPGLSSLLRPDPSVVSRYYRGGEFETDSTTEVTTLPLDVAAGRYRFTDAAFLKLDTQGTELDILTSGERLLQGPVVAVYVEAELQPFYTGQPLFADVDRFLRERGFSIFDLHRTLLRRASARGDVYSRRQAAWVHGLYFKDVEGVFDQDDATVLRQVCRLVAIALAFEHNDLALDLLSDGRPASVLREAFGDELRQDLAAALSKRTRWMLRRRCLPRGPSDVMAFAHKDRAL